MSTSSVLPLNWPGLKSSGTFFSSETMFRVESCPHIGQSAAVTTAGMAPRAITAATQVRRRMLSISLTSAVLDRPRPRPRPRPRKPFEDEDEDEDDSLVRCHHDIVDIRPEQALRREAEE